MQLRYFLSNRKLKPLLSKAPTQFETICTNTSEVRKTTSLTYAWLQASVNTQPVHFRSKWKNVLKREIPDIYWKKACIFTHKCSISTRLQVTSYKLLMYWYAIIDSGTQILATYAGDAKGRLALCYISADNTT